MTIFEFHKGTNFSSVQKFILKLIYNLPLENIPETIWIREYFKEHLYNAYSERAFFRFLRETYRMNPAFELGQKPDFVFLRTGRCGSKTFLFKKIQEFETEKLLQLGNALEFYQSKLTISLVDRFRNTNGCLIRTENFNVENFYPSRFLRESRNDFVILIDEEIQIQDSVTAIKKKFLELQKRFIHLDRRKNDAFACVFGTPLSHSRFFSDLESAFFDCPRALCLHLPAYWINSHLNRSLLEGAMGMEFTMS